MDVEASDGRVARVAAAIAEPARARMLCHLLDDRARTATELAVVAGVSASTASAHLARLVSQRLVDVLAQGRHRYFRLCGPDVARALEALLVLADGDATPFVPAAPQHLRAARTCYDHVAGALGVALFAHQCDRGWLVPGGDGFAVSEVGEAGLAGWGVDVAAARASRRRFACGCVDWSERRVHLAGSLGAALLQAALARGWLTADEDSRALALTPRGRNGWADVGGLPAQRV